MGHLYENVRRTVRLILHKERKVGEVGMTKKIIAIILLVAMMILLCGCDNSLDHPLATSVSNTKAYIRMDEKTIVVDVDAYIHGSNGVVTIYGADGTDYKTHSVNVVLIRNSEGR